MTRELHTETADVLDRLVLDDFSVGQSIDLGKCTVTEAELLAFAASFDPQAFHLDPEAASTSHYKGLIASGWHTAAIFMRLYVDGLLCRSACLGSPGVDELRWLAPVRPGDILSGHLKIEKIEVSSKHRDRGTLFPKCELRNQDGTLVFSMVLRTLLQRHPANATSALGPAVSADARLLHPGEEA